MSEFKSSDIFTKIKWYIFQIFLLIIFLLAIYDVLKQKAPFIHWPF